MAHIESWIDSLKIHGGFGDKRAKQLAKYFEAQGISKENKAKEHAEAILKQGRKLEHERTGVLHQSIHNALRNEFGLGGTPKKKVSQAEDNDYAEEEAFARHRRRREIEMERDEAEAREEDRIREEAAKANIEADEAEIKEAEVREEAAKANIEANKAEKKEAEGSSTEIGGVPAGAGGDIRNRLTNLGMGVEQNVVSVGFWLVLTLALQVIDFFWWHFGGVDYNIILSAIRAGGFELVIKIILPIYVLIMLVVILALKSSRKIGFFLFVFFVPLIIINHFALDYSVFGVSISIISLIVSMVIVIWRLPDEDRRGFLSWVLLLLTLSTIWSLGGLISGLHHIVIAILIWLFVIKEPGEPFTSANYKISALLIVDFFVYGIWQSFGFLKDAPLIANRFIIPIWFLFVVFYTRGQKQSTFAKIVKAAVIILYIIALVDGVGGWANVNAQMKGSPEEREEAKGFLTDLWSKLTAIPGEIGREIEGGIEEATGGYYKGKVEKNEEEQLGVYLENVEAADKRFYTNEQVVIWGDLEAKTLDDPITINMGCESGDVKGKIVPEKLAEGYEIEQLEQIGFECRFEPGQLKTGANNIKITADFNFETLAFLKTYFMDVERVRTLRRDNINPLTQYGIKDKKPTAVFTNGPIRLGMGTVDPPVGVNSEDAAYSYIGVTVERQWTGKINDITEVTIQVPKALQLETSGGELFCRGEFKKIDENEEGYTVYTLTEDAINNIKTPITQFRTWRCPITVPKASEILGNTPVTTYYYRANAKYVYGVEKRMSVFVKAVPTQEKTRLEDCRSSCTNSAGCICGIEGCKIQIDKEIKLGEDCNNATQAIDLK